MIYFIGEKILIPSNVWKESSIEECLKYFKDKNEIQVDTETEYNKRNPKYLPTPYESKVLCIQLGDRDNQFVIDTNLYSISLFKNLFEDPNKVKIFTNAFFDLRFIIHAGIKPKNIYDTFLAEMLLTLGKDMPKGYRGLEQMALRYCNKQLNKEIRGQIHWRGLDDTVIKYAAEDVSFLQDIKDKQMKLILRDNLQNALKLENRFVVSLARVSYNGLPINKAKWLKIASDNRIKLQEQWELLNSYIINNNFNKYTNENISGLLFPEMKVCNINWNSSPQVQKLFREIGINTKDKTGKDTVDIKVLARQQDKFEILPLYIKYKEIEKELSTYGEDFIKDNLNPVTNRIHSEFFQLVDTGRISSSNPNQQNIPAFNETGEASDFRKSFEVQDQSHDFIIADFSSQEPRTLADRSQDPFLVDFILNGDGDLHNLTATAISEYLLGHEVKVTKNNDPFVPRFKLKLRSIGKQLNLKLNYGGTAFTLKDDLNCSQEEAQEVIDALNKRTPVKIEYFKKIFKFAWDHGYVIIDEITNRRAYFYAYDELMELNKIPYDQKNKQQISRFYKLKGELERFSKNYPILYGTLDSNIY